jgi:methylated-DNA-[protein]-cysteine S-methyltransferase
MKTLLHLQLDRWNSPVGPLLIVTDQDSALRALEFGENENRLRRLLHTQYGDFALDDAKAPSAIINALSAYFRGDLGALDQLTTATNGTPFQHEVWHALRKIPAGTTISYSELARRVGRPSASRAVGAANGANPIPIVVPCHRVIGADGSLTGFGSGLPRKQWLLEHERHHASVAAAESLL